MHHRITKWKKPFLLLCILLTFTMSYLVATDFGKMPDFLMSELNCIEYLKAGVLYQGQPMCAHGPVYFYFGLLTQTVFGTRMMPLMLGLMNIALGFTIFLLVIQISGVKKTSHIMLIGFLFTFLLVPITKTDIQSLLSTILALGGLYLVFETEQDWISFIGGILFGLSCLSKINSLSTIVAVFIALTYYLWIKTRSVAKIAYRMAYYIIGFQGVIMVAGLLYPNVYVYIFWAAQQRSYGFINTIFLFLTNPFNSMDYVLFLSILVLEGCIFAKTKSPYALIAIISSVLTYFTMSMHSGVFYSIFGAYYFFLPLILLIICIGVLLTMKKKTNKKFEYITIVTMIIFALITSNISFSKNNIYNMMGISTNETTTNQYSEERVELRKIVEKPYSQLNITFGRIFVDNELNDILKTQGADISSHSNMYLFEDKSKGEPTYDRWNVPALIAYGVVKDFGPTEKIRNGEFNKIFIDSLTMELLYQYIAVSPNTMGTKNYFMAVLPSIRRGTLSRHYSFLLFEKAEDKDKLLNWTKDYYEKNFDIICNNDKWVAEEVVKRAFVGNHGYSINKSCNKGGNLITEYENNGSGTEQFIHSIITMVAFMVLIIYVLCLRV